MPNIEIDNGFFSVLNRSGISDGAPNFDRTRIVRNDNPVCLFEDEAIYTSEIIHSTLKVDGEFSSRYSASRSGEGVRARKTKMPLRSFCGVRLHYRLKALSYLFHSLPFRYCARGIGGRPASSQAAS